MRSAVLLLGGLALVGVGIGLVAGEVPGRWVLGPLLVLAGLVLKAVGLAGTGPDTPRGGAAHVRTLSGVGVERPRAGIPAGRAPLRSARPSPRPAPASRLGRGGAGHEPQRRAS